MSEALTAALTYLRRYARALTGSQQTGDDIALLALQMMVDSDTPLPPDPQVKVGLFRQFHQSWQALGAPNAPEPEGSGTFGAARMAQLTTNSREALLLRSVEMFEHAEIGTIMGISADEAEYLCGVARTELFQTSQGKVMIIEDEAVIAMDLEIIVRELGHRVTGIAATRSEARDLAAQDQPDLILADIQLADQSSGIDAVADIHSAHDLIPVIYITAFPEKLLTGHSGEPALLIRKPFEVEEVKSSIAQTMFFASTGFTREHTAARRTQTPFGAEG